jgi:thymidylate synthase
MRQYINIIEKILNDGVFKKDRTGTGCFSYPGMFFEHDMSDGFPLLTTKRMPFNLITSELSSLSKVLPTKGGCRRGITIYGMNGVVL